METLLQRLACLPTIKVRVESDPDETIAYITADEMTSPADWSALPLATWSLGLAAGEFYQIQLSDPDVGRLWADYRR